MNTSRVQEEPFIEAGTGISPVGPSKKVKATIRKAVKRIGDSPERGYARLRRSLASRFGLSGDTFVFGNSVHELLCLVLGALRPKTVLVIGPDPGIYKDASAAAGAEVSCLCGSEETGFAGERMDFRSKVREADLVCLANPDRVAGRLLGRADMESLLRSASEEKVPLVLDESLIEFTGEEGYICSARSLGNLIVMRTTAFFYGLPGLELAYAVSSPPLLPFLRREKCGAVNILAQEAARTALKDKTYVKLARRYVADEKALLARAIGKIPGITCLGSDCNVFLIRVDGFEGAMAGAFRRAGFLIEDCADIRGLGPHFFRLSVMGHDRNKKFVRVLREAVQGCRGEKAPPDGVE